MRNMDNRNGRRKRRRTRRERERRAGVGLSSEVRDTFERTCASCGSASELIADDPDANVVFCRECSSPISLLDYPEFYCDLGGCG
jgi:hypothetical protein